MLVFNYLLETVKSDPTNVYWVYLELRYIYISISWYLFSREFVFIVGLLTFLSSCVNYDVLFANNVSSNGTEKVGFEDVIYSNAVCFTRYDIPKKKNLQNKSFYFYYHFQNHIEIILILLNLLFILWYKSLTLNTL